MTVLDQRTIPPLRPRTLGGRLPIPPQEVSIFATSGSIESIHRAEIGNENGGKGHGLISRPSASVHGQVVAGSGWPAPIRRFPSFAVQPPASLPVNVITGVPSLPAAPQPRRRGRFSRGR